MNSTIALEPATGTEYFRCREMLMRHHYLRTFPDPRGMPLTYSVRLNGEWVGSIVFCRPEASRNFQGPFTYGGKADLESGKAKFDRWEVLNLARVWLDPDVQVGGRLYSADHLPGFTDRKGNFRSSFASTVIRLGIMNVRYDYLMLYPPCWVEEPYQIRVILSYCDTRVHRGVVYRASGFQLALTNKNKIETWWTEDVPPLDQERDEAIRRVSKFDARSASKRAARRDAVSHGDLFAASAFELGRS